MDSQHDSRGHRHPRVRVRLEPLGGHQTPRQRPMSTHAWIRACNETSWHITGSRNSGLALRALCGHTVWPPVHRYLTVPPVDADYLCEACQIAADTDTVFWPTIDSDSTIRMHGLSEALARLDGLDRNAPSAP